MDGGDLVAVIGIANVFFWGGVISVTGLVMHHKRSMAKIKAEEQKQGGKEVLEAVDALRREVADLRDTTTRYDVSFDTALQRLESRMGQIEQKAQRAEQQDVASSHRG